jgi:rhodanese-related sulfurtransferase
MVMEVGILDAGGLRTLLRERAAQCLLLDCRSFFAFNAGHIAGSVNVRFSTIVRRRAKGAMGLEHIVPNAELRGRLLAGAYHAVVLLDERSAALDGAKRDGTLALAAGALCREARAAQVFFLKGTRSGKIGAVRGPLALTSGLGLPHLEHVGAGLPSHQTCWHCLAPATKTCLGLCHVNS